MLEGRQRTQECICSSLGEMGARTSMKKFILERRNQKRSRQQALEADMPRVSDYSWREGGVERGGKRRWDWELRSPLLLSTGGERKEGHSRQGAGRTSW